MRAVRQPVQQRRREMFFPHHGIPITKFEIRGNDDRAAFVECRAKLEEEISPITTEGNEAKLIQDQEIVLTGVPVAVGQKPTFRTICFQQGVAE